MIRRALNTTENELEAEIFDRSIEDEELDELHARQARRLRLLWEGREFVVRATALGLMASLIVAFMIPGQYTSRTRLMPPDPQSASGMAMMAAISAKSSSGLGSVAVDLLGMKTTGALFVGVLRSETTQDRIVQQFNLTKVYGSVKDASTILDDNTAISEERKSGIVTLSVTDRSPARAAAIANAYVDQLNSLVVQLSTSAAHRERQFLEDRLRSVKQDLDDASKQFAEFSSTNNTLDIQQQGKAMLDATASLTAQMTAAQSQLAGLREIYTDNNPRVQSLSARVGEIRRELDRLSGIPKGTSGADQSQSFDMPYPSLRSLPLLGVKYADLYRRSKVEETLYQLLTEQYELAKVEEAKETPSVKVLDRAKVPQQRSFPPRLWIVASGTVLSLGLATVWVIATGSWSAVASQDPRKILAQEVAADIRKRVMWARLNGQPSTSRTQELWNRFSRRRSRITPVDQ